VGRARERGGRRRGARPLGVGPGGPRREEIGPESRRERRRRRRLGWRFALTRHPLRTLSCVLLLALAPVAVSAGAALRNPALGPFAGARLAEWAREHGGGGLVDGVENYWYRHHPPPLGGRPARGAIPATPAAAPVQPVAWHLPEPAPITPIDSPALAGEGLWHPAGRLVAGVPAIYEAFLRPDPVHTSLVAGVAWMDTKLLRAALYPGTSIPGGGPYANRVPVPAAAAATLDAAFNAGFRMNQAQGGYFTDGRAVVPLRDGAASFVIDKDGAVQIGSWGEEVGMSAQVAAVRQNLDLLVDHGAPAPGIDNNDQAKWGFTLGNSIDVWRSGVGVTSDGALVYVGGPGLDIVTLANLLVAAGAVRAMELDINVYWVNFSTYAPPTGASLATPANGSDLLASMDGGAGRYFQSNWNRDFFTMSIDAAAAPKAPLAAG